MISVMGATGNTGAQITRQLLAAGETVRVLGRSESRLARLSSEAEPYVGEPADPAFLTEAFRGADAVYTLIPFDPQWPDFHTEADRMGEAIVAAIREAGIRHVVALSAVGADLPTGTGFITSLHAQEQRLRRLPDAHVLVLRPGLFFESFYPALEQIKEQGIHGDSIAPDVLVPMVATRDVAAVAAAALVARDWSSVTVREVLGPRDLSYAEATSILGGRIGLPDLRYVQYPYAGMADALMHVGFSEDIAQQHVEMTRAINEGRITSRERGSEANPTPTRFEDFAGELASAYEAATAPHVAAGA